MAGGCVVAWFRNDLRVADNPVLLRAAEVAASSGRPLLLAYVLDPRFYDASGYGRVSDPDGQKSIRTKRPAAFVSRKCGARRARFYLNVLRDLRAALQAKGQTLQVFQGHPEDVFSKMADAHGKLHVVCLQEPVSPEWTDVEDYVEKALAPSGSTLEREWGAMSLYHREDLPFKLTESDKPSSYSHLADAFGFEDIWTKIDAREGATPIRKPAAAPTSLPAAPVEQAALAPMRWGAELLDADDEGAGLRKLGYPSEEVQAVLSKAHGGARRGKGGESAAWSRLKAWLAKDPAAAPPPPDAKASGPRDDGGPSAPSAPFCSWDLPTSDTHSLGGVTDPLAWETLSKGAGWMRISHLMACGCVSPRQMYWYAKDNAHWGLVGLVHRLLWREWHRVNAIAFGRRLFWQQGPGRVNRWWREDPMGAAQWREGRTGVPYIDACMRELNETGWLAYKGRKTCAAFLALNLDLDWRMGAFHFEEVLLDYDVAMNYGNWATCVRVDKDYEGQDFRDPTGTVLRSKLRAEVANDPDANYVKQWVPELRQMPGRLAHAPWDVAQPQADAKDTAAEGEEHKAAPNYPAPILKRKLLDLYTCDKCGEGDVDGGSADSSSGHFYCAKCWRG